MKALRSSDGALPFEDMAQCFCDGSEGSAVQLRLETIRRCSAKAHTGRESSLNVQPQTMTVGETV